MVVLAFGFCFFSVPLFGSFFFSLLHHDPHHPPVIGGQIAGGIKTDVLTSVGGTRWKLGTFVGQLDYGMFMIFYVCFMIR